MGHTLSGFFPVDRFDTLTFVGLERSHLHSAVCRRVFGDTSGPVRIGRYSILERIGAGARGVVFKAFDNQLDRLVALKVLSTRADERDELVREAKALARLSHPNVLAVYEVGETEAGQLFLATEYVKGWTLRGWYDEEHRGEASILDVVKQAGAGVQAAHDEGLVHRDLKPANILVGEDGRVRVADFGLARFDPSALDPEANVAGDGLASTTAGTPGYMAPELFLGRPASAASDQYALAVTLQELLYDGLPDPSAKHPKLPSSTIAALRRGLAEAPEDRFSSVAALVEALAEALASASATRGRRGLYFGAAALLGTVGIATAMLLTPGSQPTGPDPEVVVLKAQALLPGDPAAALEALRPLANEADARAFAVAEKALALGPEDADWRLPEGTHDPALWGDLLAYRDEDKQLVVHRLTRTDPRGVDATSLGIKEVDPIETPKGPVLMGLSAVIDSTGVMTTVAPWAARAMDRSNPDIGISKDGSRIVRLDRTTQTIAVEDTITGNTVWSLSQPAEFVNSVSIDDIGHRVAWTDSGGEAFIHDLEADTVLSLELAAAEVIFEPNGDSVVVQGRFSGVFRVRLSDGRVTRLVAQDNAFAQVEVSPTGDFIAACSRRNGLGQVHVAALNKWNWDSTVAGEAFAFSPEGSRIAAYQEQELRVVDLYSGDTHRFTVPGGVEAVQFTAEDSLWALGADNAVRHYTIQSSHVLRGHSVRDLAPVLEAHTVIEGSL